MTHQDIIAVQRITARKRRERKMSSLKHIAGTLFVVLEMCVVVGIILFGG